MKLQTFKIIPKPPSSQPDISDYVDDIMGPDLDASQLVTPCKKMKDKVEMSKIRMIKSKKRFAPFVDGDPEMEEYEEENEEGELDSETNPEPEQLTNHEQGLSHGFNPHVKQTAGRRDRKKIVDVKSIPRLIISAVNGDSHVALSYQQIRRLPGYIRNPVRALEKPLFNLLTLTPVEDIQVIANVGGDGPNSDAELAAVEKWIRSKGIPDHEMMRAIKNRFKKIKIAHTNGITHLLVSNSAGKFIFSWPSIENHITK